MRFVGFVVSVVLCLLDLALALAMCLYAYINMLVLIFFIHVLYVPDRMGRGKRPGAVEDIVEYAAEEGCSEL